MNTARTRRTARKPIRSSALRFAWIALGGLVAPACGPVPDTVTTTTTDGKTDFGSKVAVDESTGASFEAIRRFTAFTGQQSTSYTERLVRGSGSKTKVELQKLNGLSLGEMTDPGEIAQFKLLEQKLLGGDGRYVAAGRDFAVRDSDAFKQNYSWSIHSAPQVVAGRTCLVADVRPIVLDRPYYLVWADQLKFVTLKYIEYLPNGVVASEMETLDVNFKFDSSGVVFPVSPASAPVDVSETNWQGSVTFPTFDTAYLPGGFVLSSLRLSTIASHPVLAWSYTDGVQELFITQYAELGTPDPKLPGAFPGEPVHVRMMVSGALVETYFVIDGTQIHIKGKVEPEEFMTVIQGLGPSN